MNMKKNKKRIKSQIGFVAVYHCSFLMRRSLSSPLLLVLHLSSSFVFITPLEYSEHVSSSSNWKLWKKKQSYSNISWTFQPIISWHRPRILVHLFLRLRGGDKTSLGGWVLVGVAMNVTKCLFLQKMLTLGWRGSRSYASKVQNLGGSERLSSRV